MKLPLTAIREDPGIQLRGGLDMDRVEAMTEFEEQGGKLPPITVVGEDNLLADGHHRLYVAMTTGRVDIEANRLPGGPPEAVAIAIQLNDIATAKPLTRDQRNAGVKLLLQADWTQVRIAKATRVDPGTIGNIANALAMRGQIEKPGASGRGGRTPKPVATLPTAVHEKLNDTTLVRIADGVPIEQQPAFATAVAEAKLSEPRVREAIKELNAGKSPAEAVYEVAPRGLPMPTTFFEVARRVRRRLDEFLDETMLVDGVERNFWQVLDVIAANTSRVDEPSLSGLSRRLAEIAVKADGYASRLNIDEPIADLAEVAS